jgi:putative ABC transport system ATP-binding protein
MEKEAIIVCHKLWKDYTLGGSIIHALNDVNLQIFEGDFNVILGKSGSGKTTFINVITGLTQPTRGEVIIAGQKLGTMSKEELSLLRRKTIGIVFQDFNLHPDLTAIENVELPMLFAGKSKKERQRKAEHLLGSLDMKQLVNNYPNELSGGEKQRVAIARALANDPRIILADEPTGNLHSNLAKGIVELLLRINQEEKMTILMVSHDESLIQAGMRLIKLTDGKITKNGRI